MPSQPDCIVKVGSNHNIELRFYRASGWACPQDPKYADFLNSLMAKLEIDWTRYYIDPVRPRVEALIKEINGHVVKPLVYEIESKPGKVY